MVQIQSVVGELRFCKPYSIAQKKKKRPKKKKKKTKRERETKEITELKFKTL